MLSVIIPIYNEEALVEELVKRLVMAVSSLEDEYELIFVDDGCKDDTVPLLLQARNQYPEIKIISLSRNFGHQAALTAGLEYAKGNYVGMIDADLQDPPELFAEMHTHLKNGQYDVAVGQRLTRNEPGGRRFLIQLFHQLFKRVSNLQNIDQTGHFCMMTNQALQALISMKEKQRYLPGLRSFIGFRQVQVNYERQNRQAGKPKMSLGKLISLAGDALFSFSKLPLRFCLYLGLVGVLVSLFAGVHVLVSKALGWAPLGWSSTTISIYFLGSIQLTFMGVLGEYVFRTYKESQNRPVYFIRQIVE